MHKLLGDVSDLLEDLLERACFCRMNDCFCDIL
jgi:hypothetical protein